MVAQGTMVGYLSGLAVGANSDYLNNADLGSLLLWVDKYCQNSPLKNTYQAGDDLFRELKKDQILLKLCKRKIITLPKFLQRRIMNYKNNL